jgi:hypothetical protein
MARAFSSTRLPCKVKGTVSGSSFGMILFLRAPLSESVSEYYLPGPIQNEELASSVPISGPPSPCSWHEPIPQWAVVLQISPQTVYYKMTSSRRIPLRRTPTPQGYNGSYFYSSSTPSSPDHNSTRPNQRRPPSFPT